MTEVARPSNTLANAVRARSKRCRYRASSAMPSPSERRIIAPRYEACCERSPCRRRFFPVVEPEDEAAGAGPSRRRSTDWLACPAENKADYLRTKCGECLARGHSGLARIEVGGWRDDATGPMQVVSGPLGRQRVHFEAPPAERLESEMDRFLDWVDGASSEPPVIKSGLAHLWFVTPAPFRRRQRTHRPCHR